MKLFFSADIARRIVGVTPRFQIVDKTTVVRTLKTLWEYRETLRQPSGKAEKVENAYSRFMELIGRIEGRSDNGPLKAQSPVPAFDRPKIEKLKSDLLALSALAAQARGYAFEKFLKQFFDIYGLAAQQPFRLRGEQIDGSFQLASETYLVERNRRGCQQASRTCTPFTAR